ncbi:unnamed protein product [Sphenostylis stenocarpa]|uniref:MADS-box domain-containing protein n=1 Tax=Sphenostylis stenocarpa TaxID=92480 RepID=A0AA86W4T1_9FABA|nr:unnamed protein product [Sphenostylis stenocarpa]
MARKKLKLAFISDEMTRKTTYKRRKKGMIKKVDELATLCGISACAVIYNPFDCETEVWPNPEEANKVMERFKNTPVLNKSRNVNHESFMMQRIAKAQNELKMQREENYENQMTLSMFQLMQGQILPHTLQEITELDNLIQKNINEIQKKLAALNF